MENKKWMDLQLFAGEGGASGATAGDGGDAGATAPGVDNAVDAERQKLLDLGVPESKIRAKRYASKRSAGSTDPEKAAPTEENRQAAAAEERTDGENEAETPSKMSWDDIMADPEYNKEMQKVVQARLKTARASEESLTKLAPALELLAHKYGLDAENMDYDALAKAVSDDNQYYEDKALEMGVSVEKAKEVDQQERETARQKREQARTLEQQKIQQHIQRLEQQGEKMKETFPTFDLRKELQNPAFARMTAPNVGISVEDAYYAVHRNEIQAAAMQATAQRAAQKISNSIQSGQRRPTENGTTGQAPSVLALDYSKASKAQHDDLKRRIREAAARGEKLYPGQ